VRNDPSRRQHSFNFEIYRDIEECEVGEFKHLWETLSPVIKTVLLLTGGLCLLVHIAHVGRFPEDVQLGESILLYFISFGFVFLYALYWIGLTAVGLLVCRWPMEVTRLVARRAPKHAAAYVPIDLELMWAPLVWIVGLLALFISLFIYRSQHFDMITYGSLAVLQGGLGGILLMIRRRLRFDSAGLHLISKPELRMKGTNLRQAGWGLFGYWLLAPLLLGQNSGSLVDAAFTAAKIRKPHATVHVASPWRARLTQAGLVEQSSFLGANYARFDDVTVTHMSIGSRVAVEIFNRGKPAELYIPRGQIEVE